MIDVVGSFDEVFGTEYPRLVQALSVADDAAHADDAVQEAFVAAQRRWSYVAQLDDPVGWIRRAALNRLSTARRTRRRRAEILARVGPPDPDVVVRNEGEVPVRWESGGCGIPAAVVVGPSSSVASDPPVGNGVDQPRWDGDVNRLGAWLDDHNTLSPTQWHQPDDLTGAREWACAAFSHIVALEPGDPRDGGGPLPPVEVRAPLTLTDDPARTSGSSDAAIAAFAGDPRLADWIASAAMPDRPDLVQDFGTELSWWRGGWELWVDGHWGQDRLLRMRYDPGRDEVVDVRSVYLGQAPGDEPGRVAVTGEAPDEIL